MFSAWIKESFYVRCGLKGSNCFRILFDNLYNLVINLLFVIDPKSYPLIIYLNLNRMKANYLQQFFIKSLHFYFHLYVYPFDSQESIRGVYTQVNCNLCRPAYGNVIILMSGLNFLFRFFSFTEI